MTKLARYLLCVQHHSSGNNGTRRPGGRIRWG